MVKLDETSILGICSSSIWSSNSNNNTTPSKPTYSCPSGYTLSGTTCTSIINANYVCPDGTHDSVDNKCINLSEGYETEEGETCLSGYTEVKIISLGGPDKYKCYPLHSKIYTCPDGYSSHQTSKCIKTINATAH